MIDSNEQVHETHGKLDVDLTKELNKSMSPTEEKYLDRIELSRKSVREGRCMSMADLKSRLAAHRFIAAENAYHELATMLTMAYELALNVKDASLEFTVGGFGADSHRGAHIIESIKEKARSLTDAIEEIADGGVIK